MIAHHGALPGGEAVRFRPAQTNPDAQRTGLGVSVDAARIVGYVQSRYSDVAARTRHRHHGVEHGCRLLDAGVMPMSARLEADAIHGRIHLWDAQNLVDLIPHRPVLLNVTGLASKRHGML